MHVIDTGRYSTNFEHIAPGAWILLVNQYLSKPVFEIFMPEAFNQAILVASPGESSTKSSPP